MVMTGGKSRHWSFENRIAGCNALNTFSLESLDGAHLYMVTLCITASRQPVKNIGTLSGLTSLAKPYASAGDCDAGVPVIIHRCDDGVMMDLSVFQRLVVTVL